MGGIVTLRRLELFLNDNRSIIMRDVRVIRRERHCVELAGNPFKITLVRADDRVIRAHSNDLELFALIPYRHGEAKAKIPDFIIKLLS